MASPPPSAPPRSTRSRPSLPPSGIPSASSSSTSSRLDADHNSPQSANAIAHAQYTASLSGLGKSGRAGSRKKSSGQDGAERMDVDPDRSAGQQALKSDLDAPLDSPVKDEFTDADGASALASSAPSELADGSAGADGSAREAAPSVVVRPPSIEQEDESAQQDKPTNEDDAQDEEDEEDEDEEGADVTRCVCGITESDDMMIQCDTCNVWQHGACVGIPTEEETPDEYFCEKCQPGLHVALKKWMRTMSRGRGGIFLPPSASDLHRLNPDDLMPPNQSKRWTHDLPNLPPLDGQDSDSESDRGGGRGRRSRSNRNRSKQPASVATPASSATTAAASASTAQKSHRPLPFPPRRTTAPPAGGPAGPAAAGPSSTASTSTSHHASHPSTSAHPGQAKSHKRQVSSSSNHHAVSHRQLSPIPPSSSQSPPPAKLKSPKKRSTMNSRDAGLEEAIRESLLAAGGLPEDEKAGSSRRSPSSNGSARDRSEPAERRAVAGTKRGRRASVESSAAPGEVGGTGGRKGKKAKKDVALSIDPTIPTSPSSHPGPPSSSASHHAKGGPDSHLDHHGHHKAKHPNQYTYRPKTSPSSAAFPDKPTSSSHHASGSTSKDPIQPPQALSPSKPAPQNRASHASLSSAAHEHGTRRNGGPASGGGGGSGNGGGGGGRSSTPANGSSERPDRPERSRADPGSGTGTSTPTWSIPDHLSHLASFLPTVAPQPLLIGVNPPPSPPPSLPQTDPAASTTSASAPPLPKQKLKPFTTAPRSEPPTKIKWPGKRMTVGEMRKRVRAILDFVGRWPVGDRPLPLPASLLLSPSSLNEGEDGVVGETKKKKQRGTRAEEVEELVRDLIAFEQRFGSAAFGTSGLRSGGEVIQPAQQQPAVPPRVEVVETVVVPVKSAPSDTAAEGEREGEDVEMGGVGAEGDVEMGDAPVAERVDVGEADVGVGGEGTDHVEFGGVVLQVVEDAAATATTVPVV